MPDNYFNDKVVIITGARQGIGRTLAVMLASSGSKLVINSRNADKLSSLKNHINP